MCEVCKNYPCLNRCPNHMPQKTLYYCSICNDGIQNGEEYIENGNGEFAHYECVDYAKKMAEFLGYDIKEMEDD